MNTPTLVVGIGGIGSEIVAILDDRIKREKLENVALVVMDTDVNGLRTIHEKHNDIYIVQTSPKGTVGRALDTNEYARERWFPLNDGLIGKPFTEGAGQVRAVSRLAFDYAVEQGYMENLEKAIAKLHGLNGDDLQQEMRIIITGSIAGGTGSGLVLPVAMYIRNFLITRYQDNSAIIRGFFLEPDVVFGRLLDEDERNSQRANAYAAVRELNAFFRKEYSGEGPEYEHIVFNAPQPGLGTHVDYPNILPYHFVFLMDALNEDGSSLTDAEGRYDLVAYKQHAADCIYAQALSAMTSRSNSSEDNVIRKLAANNGLSRYCGAGTSCLEYPKETVQRYIALNWAEQNLTGEWLEIDEAYKRERRSDEDLKLPSFYLQEFSERDSPFYRTIKKRSERKDKNGNLIPEVDLLVEAIEEHAEDYANGALRSECLPLRQIDDYGSMSPLPESTDAILASVEDDPTPGTTLQTNVSQRFTRLKQYSGIARGEVPGFARMFAKSSFRVPEASDNPLRTRTQEWQIEHLFRVVDGGAVGSFHPSAVRNKLYELSAALEAKHEEALSDVDETREAMRRYETMDYYAATSEEKEDPTGAVGKIFAEGEGGKRRFNFPFIGGGDALSEEVLNGIASIDADLNKYLVSIDAFIASTVKEAFVKEALDYVERLASAYETFYKYLGTAGLGGIEKEIASIELSPAFNESKGKAHRYVCANRECLSKMKSICFRKGSAGDLPIELCGDIYKSLLTYAKRREELSDYGARNEASNRMLKKIFDDVVIKYWTEQVEDVEGGYPDVVDKGIVQAIGDESLYLADQVFLDDAEANAYAKQHVLRTLTEARTLSAAFIEKPIGEVPRHIETCAYAQEAAFEGAGAYADDVKRTLENTYNGQAADDKEFSKYEILFYSSLYGFLAQELPKYAPEHDGKEFRPEGEYHRAYYALVDQLSPNLRENKVITPHIDKTWHLVSCLPDLNEENERRINEDIVHAYLFGLIFQKFDAEKVSDGDDIYYLKPERNRAKMSLWVSNGTPCDRFYEVYDALKCSPPMVNALLERSQERLDEERNNTLALSLDSCKLIERIRSRAFDEDLPFEEWVERILRTIDGGLGTSDIPPRLVPYKEGSEGDRGRLETSAVTNLFGYGIDEPRTSIFEIPLLYRISLPQTELREGEIDMMVESIFNVVEAHLANFSDDSDLIYKCCIFFQEQYLLLEWNLIAYEEKFKGIVDNPVVGIIRDKARSYIDQSSSLGPRVEMAQNKIKSAWDRLLA